MKIIEVTGVRMRICLTIICWLYYKAFSSVRKATWTVSPTSFAGTSKSNEWTYSYTRILRVLPQSLGVFTADSFSWLNDSLTVIDHFYKEIKRVLYGKFLCHTTIANIPNILTYFNVTRSWPRKRKGTSTLRWQSPDFLPRVHSHSCFTWAAAFEAYQDALIRYLVYIDWDKFGRNRLGPKSRFCNLFSPVIIIEGPSTFAISVWCGLLFRVRMVSTLRITLFLLMISDYALWKKPIPNDAFSNHVRFQRTNDIFITNGTL